MVEFLSGNRIRGTSTERTMGSKGVSLTGTQTTSGTTATSLSVSINVGDHINKALIVCVTQQSGSTTSVKVGSNSFTNMGITNGGSSGTGSQRTEIWYLLDSDITNNAINQIDWVGSAGSRISIGVYSLYNVNQGGSSNTFTFSEAYNTSSSYSNQPNGVVNSVNSGEFILDILSANSATQPTDTLAEGWNILISTNRYAVSQYNLTPTTNNDMSYSNIQSAEWAWSGARIKSAPVLQTVIPSGTTGCWRELKREKITSAAMSVNVTGLPDKRYYMVLTDLRMSAQTEGDCFRLNNDTSYSSGTLGRFAARAYKNLDKSTQSDFTSKTKVGWFGEHPHSQPAFSVGYLANKSGEEKLGINQAVCCNNSAGTGVSGGRSHVKYVPASLTTSISEVNIVNGWNNYDVDSEVVVLGWDEGDTHQDNFWEELASVDLSGGVADTLECTFTPKKYLWVQAYMQLDGSQIAGIIRFNDESTGSNYSRQRSNNGATGSNENAVNAIDVRGGEGKNRFENLFIINNASTYKLVIGDMMVSTEGSGSSGIPDKTEYVAKWTVTSEQINKITFSNADAGSYGTKSIIKVWGHD